MTMTPRCPQGWESACDVARVVTIRASVSDLGVHVPDDVLDLARASHVATGEARMTVGRRDAPLPFDFRETRGLALSLVDRDHHPSNLSQQNPCASRGLDELSACILDVDFLVCCDETDGGLDDGLVSQLLGSGCCFEPGREGQ